MAKNPFYFFRLISDLVKPKSWSNLFWCLGKENVCATNANVRPISSNAVNFSSKCSPLIDVLMMTQA